MKLLSTRARAQLWKLQEAVRHAARERERCLRMLTSGRAVLTASAHRDLWMEFSCADQEYHHAITRLADFVQHHSVGHGTDSELFSGPAEPGPIPE